MCLNPEPIEAFNTMINRVGRGVVRDFDVGSYFTIVCTYPYQGPTEEQLQAMEEEAARRAEEEALEREDEEKRKRQEQIREQQRLAREAAEKQRLQEEEEERLKRAEELWSAGVQTHLSAR